MNKKHLIFILLLILAGCGKTNKSAKEDKLIVIDVTKNYEPTNISIDVNLDSVEFIPLETNADFLCAEGEIIAFTDELIIYSNYDWQGSDILIFDAKGKALKKINRRGPSGEEYAYKEEVVYDYNSRELFVNDGALRKIFVYDLEGNYKRSFPYLENIEHNLYIYNLMIHTFYVIAT